MVKHLLFVTMVIACYGSSAHAAPPSNTNTSLCEPSEIDLFSCDLPPKVVSICGQQHDRAVYRFGRPGHIEIELTNLHFADEFFSGGGETQVYADKSNYRYIVYDRMIRTRFDGSGHFDSRDETGLVVKIGERVIMQQACSGDAFFNQHTDTFVPGGDYADHDLLAAWARDGGETPKRSPRHKAD